MNTLDMIINSFLVGPAAKPDYPQSSGHGRGGGAELSWWLASLIITNTLVSPSRAQLAIHHQIIPNFSIDI